MNSPRTVHDAARTEGLIKWVTAIAIVIGVVGAFIVWLNNLEYHPASSPAGQAETTSKAETSEATTTASQSTATASDSTKVSPEITCSGLITGTKHSGAILPARPNQQV